MSRTQDSLFYRVFKFKYFSDGSFLDAPIPSHSSYAWRSVAQSRTLLIQGSRWRVVNGTKINIWQDKWLPMAFNQKVISPRTILPAKARVADLIDTSSFQPRWKGTLIDSVFYPFEADTVISIPLNFRLPPDSLIWTKNKAGNFTVRSAYFLQKELENASYGNLASSSHSGRRHSFWNIIRSSLIPPKIKSFIWRACTDSLPLRTKLFDKRISSSYSCVLCSDVAESCSHILWECSFAQAVWFQAPFRNSFHFSLALSGI